MESPTESYLVLGGGKDGRHCGEVLEVGIQISIGGGGGRETVHGGARDESCQ